MAALSPSKVILAGLVLAAAGAATRPAAAQTHDAAAGEALFQEGRRLMKNREFAAACPKLEESYRLDPALGTLVNLASCEEELGHSASAWQHWRSAADQLETSDKRRATAVTRAAALEKILARLTIALKTGAPDASEVVRDGVKLGQASLGVALPVDPGRHAVVVSAPGREPRTFEVTIAAKERRTLTVEPGNEVAPPPEVAKARSQPPVESGAAASVRATPPPEPKRAGSSMVGYGLLAGGVAALAVAGFAGSQALAARSDAEKLCANRLCMAGATSALDKDKRFSLITDVSAGAGIVLAAAGLYFILRSPSSEGGTTALVAPLPGGGQVGLGGTF